MESQGDAPTAPPQQPQVQHMQAQMQHMPMQSQMQMQMQPQVQMQMPIMQQPQMQAAQMQPMQQMSQMQQMQPQMQQMQPQMQPQMQQMQPQPQMQPQQLIQPQMQPMQQQMVPQPQQMQQQPQQMQQQQMQQPQMQPMQPMFQQQFTTLEAHPQMSNVPFSQSRSAGDIEPAPRVRCTRSNLCVKVNGHRGRCALQQRAKDEDLVQIVHQIREMQAEVDVLKTERDRLQKEVTTLWRKLSKTCNFLGVLVRSKRSTRSSSSLTADECQRELTKISFECLQLEAAEKREQFAASLNFLETTDGLTPAQERERKADIQTYKRQFEQDMMQTNFSHKAAAASNAAEMVPYMMVAQTMNVTEMILNQGPRK